MPSYYIDYPQITFLVGDGSNQGAHAGGGGTGERKEWLVLEGTVGANGKSIKAVGEAQLKILRAARGEVKHDNKNI